MLKVVRRERDGEVARASQGIEFAAVLKLRGGAVTPSHGRPMIGSALQEEDLPGAGNQAPPTSAWLPSLSLGAHRLARRSRGGRGKASA